MLRIRCSGREEGEEGSAMGEGMGKPVCEAGKEQVYWGWDQVLCEFRSLWEMNLASGDTFEVEFVPFDALRAFDATC